MNLKNKLALCWRILHQEENKLMAHARRELPPADGDEMQELMNQQLLENVLVFSTHGHSGSSAAYALHSLKLLLNCQPLRPLTGEDSEWVHVAENLWQNNRCGHVFKEGDGRAYDSRGKVFVEANGAAFTCKDSRVYVTFPYVPAVEYVNVP